jgi:hypothetical protein
MAYTITHPPITKGVDSSAVPSAVSVFSRDVSKYSGGYKQLSCCNFRPEKGDHRIIRVLCTMEIKRDPIENQAHGALNFFVEDGAGFQLRTNQKTYHFREDRGAEGILFTFLPRVQILYNEARKCLRIQVDTVEKVEKVETVEKVEKVAESDTGNARNSNDEKNEN